MKKALLSTLALLLFSILTFAQTAPAGNITIKGSVVDSAKNEAMSYATVAVVDATTNQPVKSTFTKDDGSFILSGLAAKAYKVSLVNIGYNTKIIALDNPKEMNDLGKLQMSASSGQLKEVNVTAVKPLMKREVDRISYDVQADPESKVLSALDLMRRVPLLSVDANDNIKLQGNTNYKILVNGKPSAIIANSPGDVLKSMPASNILKIEVITTPPAKYDAEGLAGIINIITKKDMDQGYNGSINARYNTLWGPGLNLNMTVKQGKFGLAGYVGGNKRNNLTNNTTSLNDNFGVSRLTQEGERTNGGRQAYASTELTYEQDTLNLFTGTFEYYNGRNTSYIDQLTNLDVLAGTNNDNRYRALNDAYNQYRGISGGLNYQLGFKRNKEQLLTASYKYNFNGFNQFNDVSFVERVNYPNTQFPDYQQYNRSGSKEHTAQLDYVHPAKKLNIEAGAKAIFRNNFSDVHNDKLDPATGQYVTDPVQINDFNYQQNVYSLYNTYQYKLSDKWMFKGGLRLEHTTVNANAGIDQRYSNLIPSLSIQRSFKSSSVNFGYTDRIQRPGIWQLNPFVNSQNPNFIEVGNPDLRPVVSHGLELTYSNFKKGSINLGVNYRFANNTVENITTINPNTAVSVSTYQNVGASKRLGGDFNLNYPLTKKLNVNINSQLMRVWLKGYVNGVFYSTKGNQGHIFSGANYKFDNGYRLGLNIDYDSRYVMLQGRDNYWFGYGASASKELFKQKATISINTNTPFQKFRTIDNTVRLPNSYQYTVFNMYARQFNISFNYKFGKLSSDLKKNQRGINNDDVSSGGSRN
ncbi:TonB-dependent receptor [Mucilaginibacter daejeonensis]|uniref:outer membrane beta-barrel family protein n=1 Tax=Mucilaginibacter daejeonensis TaxID=398049 RepID=UPI001D17C634|nr:outer membrane beta-barrel family protein [Mucilaginibacter daejeonensis]UEG54245.1 TonB-dependent receptor [Mucilaginibacter daejeonensis]